VSTMAERQWIILSTEPHPGRQERLERDLAADRQRRIAKFAAGGSGGSKSSRLRTFVRAVGSCSDARSCAPVARQCTPETSGSQRT
jgi:hypothetical protein